MLIERHNTSGPSNAVSTAPKRTPNAVSPAIHRPAAIIQPTMGG